MVERVSVGAHAVWIATTDHAPWSLGAIVGGPCVAERHPLLLDFIAHGGIYEISFVIHHLLHQPNYLLRPRLEIRWIEATLAGDFVHALHFRPCDWVQLCGGPRGVLVDTHQRLFRENLRLRRQVPSRHHAVSLAMQLLYPHNTVVEQHAVG